MKQLLTSIALLLVSNLGYGQVTDKNYYSNYNDSTDSVYYYIQNAYSPWNGSCRSQRYYPVLIFNADSFTVSIVDTNYNEVFFSNVQDSCWSPTPNEVYVGYYMTILTYWTDLNTPREKMVTIRQKFICIT